MTGSADDVASASPEGEAEPVVAAAAEALPPVDDDSDQPGLPPGRAETGPAHRRRGLVVLAGVAAACVLAAGLAQATSAPPVPVVAQDPGQADAQTPLTPGSTLPAEVVDPEARQAALDRLLLDRGEAVRRRDAATWKRQQTPGAATPDFADLAALPLTRWSYRVDSLTSGDDPTRLSLGVRVGYRLDVDAEDSVLRETLTLQHSGTGWRVSSERGSGSRAQPWDLGTVSTVRGTASLIIGIDVPTTTLTRYAALADSVAADVSRVWGRDWTRHPVLVVGRSTSQVARGLGRTTASLAKIAAVTTAEDGDGTGTRQRGADRVWTNTPVMSSLSALGREIVLRHEILHVATGAAATNATPLWLEEGLAELVGYRGSGVPLAVATGDVLRRTAAGRGPTSLPDPDAFSGPGLATAYESAHLACQAIVDDVGIAGLVRVYRLTAAGDGTPDQNVDAALSTVTSAGTDALEVRWRALMRRLAG